MCSLIALGKMLVTPKQVDEKYDVHRLLQVRPAHPSACPRCVRHRVRVASGTVSGTVSGPGTVEIVVWSEFLLDLFPIFHGDVLLCVV